MDTLEVLERTENVLKDRGWTKGGDGWTGGRGNGPLCLEGAFLRALGHEVDWRVGEPNPMQLSEMISHPAYKLLQVMAGCGEIDCPCCQRLASWNDSHSEWAVHDLLQRAIKKVRKEPKPVLKKLDVVIPPAQVINPGEEKVVSVVEIVSSAPDYVPESWIVKAQKKVLAKVS